jgi:dTDP-4-amino-4,6-dideoxygalactose transaminase
MKVNFLDLQKQYKRLKPQIDAAVKEFGMRSDFILGRDVSLFEEEFSRYCATKFAVGVNSGTDALFLSLAGSGIGEADEVIVPVFTFIATAFAVSYTGANPVFVDIDERTYNIDVNKIEDAITKKTRAIVPVHLFGQMADMRPIMKIAAKYKLKVIEDACQSHGSVYKPWSKKAGSIGCAGCFSFYPTKNVGGWGDGGMVITDNKKLRDKLMILRDCGRGLKTRYEHVLVGNNSRLDTLQAAILRVKLRYLDRWNQLRAKNSKLYSRLLKDSPGIILPYNADYSSHIFHVYAVRVRNRDKVAGYLKSKGINVAVFYPLPLHLQPAYRNLGYKRGDFPVAEKVAKEILALPMHPFLSEKEIRYVANNLNTACIRF